MLSNTAPKIVGDISDQLKVLLAPLRSRFTISSVKSVQALNSVRNIVMIFFNRINDISAKIISSIGIPEFIVLIIIAVVAFGRTGLIVFFSGKAVANLYQEYCYDEISLFVALVSIVGLVWFADYMPINIVLLLILSHIVYIGIRWYINGYKENH